MRIYTRYLLFTFILFSSVFSAKAGVTAGFIASPTSGCAPLVVYFKNTSTGAASYKWDYGNGTISYSALDTTSTAYLAPGTYTAKLTAYDGKGDSSVYTTTIIVYPPPTVSFSVTDTGVCPGTPITFTSTSTGGVPGPLTYVWDFGDGDTTSTATPVYTYTASGYYNVTLTATNSKGCVASLTKSLYIHVYDPPVANFSGTTVLCNVPAHAVFTDLSTGSAPFTYSWTFGDGSTSTLANPVHDYSASGTYTVSLVITDSHGCTSTIKTTYIKVNSLTTNFVSVDTACVNSNVTFTDTTKLAVSSTWTYGDGSGSSGFTGSHSYSLAGTYTVTLVIFNGGCYDTVKHTIVILPGPTASFTISPIHPCPPPTTLTFTGTVPTGCSVSWKFGDGHTGTGTTASNTYTAPGVYNITMTVTDPKTGCVTVVTRKDTLYDMILRVFANPREGCVPLTVNFSDTVQTSLPGPGKSIYPFPVTSWSWTFGDGSSSSVASPTHTYTAVGTYWAHLTITTSNGCTFTDSVKIIVSKPPVITAKAIPTHVCYGQASTFVITLVSGPADSFSWNFGDGRGLETDSVFIITDTFLLPGIFTVTVTPYYHGCEGPPYVIPTPIIVDSPKAIIRYNVSCSPANRVAFFDESLGDNTRLWIFGDGKTDTSNDPVHDYAAAGIYTVTLATYNKLSGCRDTARVTIDLYGIVPDFTAAKLQLCAYSPDKFTSIITGKGTVTNYLWSSSGSVSDSTSSTYDPVFYSGGVYTIRLIVTDENGCKDTVVKPDYITVGQPVVNFTAVPVSGCAPLTVTFTDHSTDVAGLSFTGYSWDFGDGGTASILVPTATHTFSVGGAFSTTETVTDNIGCKGSATLSLVNVYQPIASFTADKFYPCAGDMVTFTNTSTGATSAYWTFGDGDTSTVISPTHVYTITGYYTVMLAVKDAYGCTDTAIYKGYIYVTEPVAAFHMSDSFAICPPLTVNFINTSTGAIGYGWTFGDGSSSSKVNPSDLYITTGTYTIILTAVNKYGCVSTATDHVTIVGSSGAFTYTPIRGCSPLTVHFKSLVSNVPSIIWDFSDGSTALSTFTDTIDHTYTIPGAYVPKLVLSDGTGCQASELGPDTIKVDAVTPNFTTIPNPVCVDETVHFKDMSTSYFSTITSWLWTFTNGDTSTLNSPAYFYDSVGTYPVHLVATDGWGCVDSITENVIVFPPAPITASPDTTICLTDAATLTAYGGVSYTWTPTNTVSCTNCNPTFASPTTATTYTVTGTDKNGCMNTDTVTVFLKYKTISTAHGDTAVCKGIAVPLHDSGATKYTWIPGTGLSSAYIADPWATPPVTTTYAVIAQLAGCIADTNYVTVVVHPLPTVDAGPDQRVLEGSTAQLNATGTNIYKYAWDQASTLSCDICPNPVASMTVTTTYGITVSTDFGCKSSDSVTIFIYCDASQVFIPNTFTPNGDGQNDVFYPRGKGISQIKSFRIYNRWGQLLFERSDISINDAANAWDGSYLGSMPRPDVYVYIIDAFCDTGAPINIKGDVTIIK